MIPFSPLRPFEGMEPITDITPFTKRAGDTYLTILEKLAAYLDYIAESITGLDEKIVTEVNKQLEEMRADVQAAIDAGQALTDEKLEAYDDKLVQVFDYLNGRISDAQEAMNDAVQQVVNSSIEVQDPVVAALVNDPESASRVALDSKYTLVGDAVSSVNGRKGTVVLSPADVNGSTEPTSGTIPVRGSGGTVPGVANPVNPTDAANRSTVDAVSSVMNKRDASDWAAAVHSLSGDTGKLLSIPTHVSAGGGEVVHPSVVSFDIPWNGYKYWMAVTPYPGGNDAHEDPNVVASDDGLTWVVPQGLANPIDNQGGSPGAYNSDTDIVYAQNKLWVFWRTYNQSLSSNQEKIYVSSSSDGVVWSPKAVVYQTSNTVRRLVSPSLVFSEGRWTMFAVDVLPQINQVVKLTTRSTSPYEGEWGNPVNVSFDNVASGSNAWHIEVRKVGEGYIAVVNDCLLGSNGAGGNLYISHSFDGVNFSGSKLRIIPQDGGSYSQLYRATFTAEFIGGREVLRLWYSAWQIGNPTVWNVYHTILDVSGGRGVYSSYSRIVSGDNSEIAAATGKTIEIQFPQGRFSRTPTINVNVMESTRLSVAVLSPSKDKVTVRLDNFTSAFALYKGFTVTAVQDTP